MADQRKVGVLGGGQLGRMLIEAANRLNIQVNVLDAANSPAKQISAHDGHIEGSFKDAAKVKELAQKCDVVTVEIEHVDTQMLEEVAGQVTVEPSWKTLRTIKDKYAQKEHLKQHGVDVAESIDLEGKGAEGLKEVGTKYGYPYMLRARQKRMMARETLLSRARETSTQLSRHWVVVLCTLRSGLTSVWSWLSWLSKPRMASYPSLQ
jgi:phosphoribosylaminoimidazole carboxylase